VVANVTAIKIINFLTFLQLSKYPAPFLVFSMLSQIENLLFLVLYDIYNNIY